KSQKLRELRRSLWRTAHGACRRCFKGAGPHIGTYRQAGAVRCRLDLSEFAVGNPKIDFRSPFPSLAAAAALISALVLCAITAGLADCHLLPNRSWFVPRVGPAGAKPRGRTIYCLSYIHTRRFRGERE